ncbi:hypothetical protein ACLOJK_007487, partial [Asimina triloba]
EERRCYAEQEEKRAINLSLLDDGVTKVIIVEELPKKEALAARQMVHTEEEIDALTTVKAGEAVE